MESKSSEPVIEKEEKRVSERENEKATTITIKRVENGN